jgi:hypothetical protein
LFCSVDLPTAPPIITVCRRLGHPLWRPPLGGHRQATS